MKNNAKEVDENFFSVTEKQKKLNKMKRKQKLYFE